MKPIAPDPLQRTSISTHTHGKKSTVKPAIHAMQKYLSSHLGKSELPRELGVVPQIPEGGVFAHAGGGPAAVGGLARLLQVEDDVDVARLRRRDARVPPRRQHRPRGLEAVEHLARLV